MAYEVEKRSKLTRAQYARLQSHLDTHATFLGEKRLDSFLFRKPSYLRIRLSSDDPNVYITEKTGTYADAARFEKDTKIKRAALPGFVDKLQKRGFQECVPVITYRRTYILDGLKMELNRINYLGLILEVEVVTNKKSAVLQLEQKVSLMLTRLRVKELPANIYQGMLDRNYRDHLVDIRKISFAP